MPDLKREVTSLHSRDLHELQAWISERLGTTELSRQIVDVVADSKVLRAKQSGTAYFRLEIPQCKKRRCQLCANNIGHEPMWFVYWFDVGGTLRSACVGELFDIGPILDPTEGELVTLTVT